MKQASPSVIIVLSNQKLSTHYSQGCKNHVLYQNSGANFFELVKKNRCDIKMSLFRKMKKICIVVNFFI
jgi:hypothetical protein